MGSSEMLKILLSHNDSHNGAHLFKALSQDGYRVTQIDRVDMIWNHIEKNSRNLFFLILQRMGLVR